MNPATTFRVKWQCQEPVAHPLGAQQIGIVIDSDPMLVDLAGLIALILTCVGMFVIFFQDGVALPLALVALALTLWVRNWQTLLIIDETGVQKATLYFGIRARRLSVALNGLPTLAYSRDGQSHYMWTNVVIADEVPIILDGKPLRFRQRYHAFNYVRDVRQPRVNLTKQFLSDARELGLTTRELMLEETYKLRQAAADLTQAYILKIETFPRQQDSPELRQAWADLTQAYRSSIKPRPLRRPLPRQFGGFMLVTGVVFFSMVVLITNVLRLPERVNLATKGVQTTDHVTTLEYYPKSRGSSTSPYPFRCIFTYQFTASDGRRYGGESLSSEDYYCSLQPGDLRTVTYNPRHPASNVADDPSVWTQAWTFGLLGLLSLGLAIIGSYHFVTSRPKSTISNHIVSP